MKYMRKMQLNVLKVIENVSRKSSISIFAYKSFFCYSPAGHLLFIATNQSNRCILTDIFFSFPFLHFLNSVQRFINFKKFLIAFRCILEWVSKFSFIAIQSKCLKFWWLFVSFLLFLQQNELLCPILIKLSAKST